MEYPSNALAMMDAWIAQASEDDLAAMGLLPGDDAAYAAEVFGTDAYTMENTVVSSAGCVESFVTEEAASTLAAAGAALLAVALLN